MWFFRGITILIGVIAFLWLATQNAGEQINFRFFTKDLSPLNLNMFMLLVFASGMVFAFLVSVVGELGLRRQISLQRKELLRMERELSALRNLPLDDAESGPGTSI